MLEFLAPLRRQLRRWLGIAAIQRQIRDLEASMLISKEDVERLNAATSRIGARVASLLDMIEALGTGNDDEVRAAQRLEDIQAASADLRPLIEQLEGLGADATEVVPVPAPDQAPVEPGPDVPPVENLPEVDDSGADDAVVDAPVEPSPATDPAPVEPVPAGSDVPAEEPVPAPVDAEPVVSVPVEDANVEEVAPGESTVVEAPVDAPVTVITAPVDAVSGPGVGDPTVVEVPVSEATVEEVPAGETLTVDAPEDEPITVITAPSESVSEGVQPSDAGSADGTVLLDPTVPAAGDTVDDESL